MKILNFTSFPCRRDVVDVRTLRVLMATLLAFSVPQQQPPRLLLPQDSLNKRLFSFVLPFGLPTRWTRLGTLNMPAAAGPFFVVACGCF